MENTPRIKSLGFTSPSAFQANLSFPATSPTSFSETPKATFKDVMVNLIKDTDKTLTEPDEMMNRAMTTGDVDIHEVMIANAKADITVNIASQVVTKVIQAYERVQQIQV